MKRGENMVEQVFHTEAQTVEIALGRTRQVGAARGIFFVTDAVAAESHREETRKSVTKIVGQSPNESTP